MNGPATCATRHPSCHLRVAEGGLGQPRPDRGLLPVDPHEGDCRHTGGVSCRLGAERDPGADAVPLHGGTGTAREMDGAAPPQGQPEILQAVVQSSGMEGAV